MLGVLLALVFENPWADFTKGITQRFLSLAVVGLGAGMNLAIVAKVGLEGIGYTVLSIALALIIGTALGRILKTTYIISLLVTVGTAICGGSAIAAVSPIVKAKDHEVSVSLGIVFLLNAFALFLFPWIGHQFNLSEGQFGLWSALAIHDTSSVVGATLQYGAHALEVGTTVKLARALWIVPITIALGHLVARTSDKNNGSFLNNAKRPWFILGFVLMAAVVTWIPDLKEIGHYVEIAAKQLLVLTLFLIGSNLSRETLRNVGLRPFLQGLFLWMIMASGTLIAIVYGWIV